MTKIDRASHLMTDEAGIYVRVGREFAGHSKVNHSANEYVTTGGFKHRDTVGNVFSIFKRGVSGTYHYMSEPISLATVPSSTFATTAAM